MATSLPGQLLVIEIVSISLSFVSDFSPLTSGITWGTSLPLLLIRWRVQAMELHSVITCPECDHSTTEIMPTDACQYIYDCKGCGPPHEAP